MSEPRGIQQDRWSFAHDGPSILIKKGWNRLKGTDGDDPFETGSVDYTGDVDVTVDLGATFPAGQWPTQLWLQLVRVDEANNATGKTPLPIYFDENDWRAHYTNSFWVPAGNRIAVDIKLVGLETLSLHDFIFRGVSIPRRQNVRVAA